MIREEKKGFEINIDKASCIPLYIQVERQLRKLISDWEHKEIGHPITEQYLQDKFRVSRNTIRQAVLKLVDEGILIRKRAKGISIVSNSSKVMSETTDGLSFTEAAIKRGHKPTAKTLEAKIIKPPKEVRDSLSLDEYEEVFYSKKVRYLDDVPASIAEYYIPLKVAPKISKNDFSETGSNQSVHYVLERYYDLHILKWVESIEAIKASKEEAEILGISKGIPLLLRTDIIYSTEGKNVVYSKIIMTENYKIIGLVYKKEHLQ